MDFLSKISTRPKAEPVFGGQAKHSMCFKAGLSGNLQPVVDFSSFCISLANLWFFFHFLYNLFIYYLLRVRERERERERVGVWHHLQISRWDRRLPRR